MAEDDFIERRSPVNLAESQIEEIAERAAEKAIAKMTGEFYKSVGQTVVSKILWIIGAAAFGLWFWLKKNGLIE